MYISKKCYSVVEMLLGSIKIYPWYWFWSIGGILISTIHADNFYYKHDAPKLLILDIFLAIYVIIKTAYSRNMYLSWSGLLVCVFLFFCLMSLFWAPNKYAGLLELNRYVLIALALYWLVQDLREFKNKFLPLTVFLFSACAFFIVLFVERYVLELPYNNGSYTPLGFINHGGHVYIIWLSLFVGGVIYLKRYLKMVSLILASLSCWILADSAIRASIYGVAVGCLIAVLILLFKNKKSIWKPLSVLGLLVLMVGSVQLFSDRGQHLSKKIARSAKITNLQAASSNRVTLFSNTIEMIENQPMGVGLSNFEYIHPLYAQPGEKGQASPNVNERKILRTPHNYLLKITSEIGWIGGVSAMLLCLMWLLYAIRNATDKEPLSIFYCIATIAVLFNAQFSAVFSNPASLFFSLLLIGGVLSQSSKAISISLKIPLSNTYKLILIIAIFGAVILSSSFLKSQRQAYLGKRTADTLLLMRATSTFPGNERAWYDLAVTTFEQDRNSLLGIKYMRHFLGLYPYHISGRFKLAQWLYREKQYRNAQVELERLLRYYPNFKSARNLHKQVSKVRRKKNW